MSATKNTKEKHQFCATTNSSAISQRLQMDSCAHRASSKMYFQAPLRISVRCCKFCDLPNLFSWRKFKHQKDTVSSLAIRSTGPTKTTPKVLCSLSQAQKLLKQGQGQVPSLCLTFFHPSRVTGSSTKTKDLERGLVISFS